jgi:preprotein translocase subunit Sss1
MMLRRCEQPSRKESWRTIKQVTTGVLAIGFVTVAVDTVFLVIYSALAWENRY